MRDGRNTMWYEEKKNKQYGDQQAPRAHVLMATICSLFACLMPQHHANTFQGQIWSDKWTCCHTEIEVADQTFYLPQSRYTDTWRTSPSADPITPGTQQGNH